MRAPQNAMKCPFAPPVLITTWFGVTGIPASRKCAAANARASSPSTKRVTRTVLSSKADTASSTARRSLQVGQCFGVALTGVLRMVRTTFLKLPSFVMGKPLVTPSPPSGAVLRDGL